MSGLIDIHYATVIACGSGPFRAVAHPVRAKRVGDGRKGETRAGPADGLPEVRAPESDSTVWDVRGWQ